MKNLLKKILARLGEPWPQPSPSQQENEALKVQVETLLNKLAVAEQELARAKTGNKALQDFIAVRYQPDKTLTSPPKIVRPFVALLFAMAFSASAAFPPPYVHNYWDTNLIPTDATLLTNAASARTLTTAAGLTNGTIPDARLSSNAALLDRNPQLWLGSNHIAGAFEGSGLNLTNLNASQLATGTVPTARLDTLANQYPGALTNNDTRSITLVGPVNSTNSFKVGTNTAVICYATVDVTNSTSSSIGSTTIFTAPVSGIFDADVFLAVTVAGSAGTVLETLAWTDEIGATTLATSTLNLNAQGRLSSNMTGRYIIAGSTLAYSTTVSGATGSPTYTVHIRIKFMP